VILLAAAVLTTMALQELPQTFRQCSRGLAHISGGERLKGGKYED
jgi:hypothetical protein